MKTEKQNLKKTQTPKTNTTKPTKLASVTRNWKAILLWTIVIVIITNLSYYSAFKNGITNYDDNLYITENPFLHSLASENIKTMFKIPEGFYMGNYHPFSMVSLAIDYHFQPDGYKLFHVTNIVLHTLNTLLVFLLVFLLVEYTEKRKPEKRSWKLELAIISAALFGVHTIHSESVAWVSERKDVLYTFFFLISLVSYVRYMDTLKSKFIIGSLLAFLCSLLSKGQAVSLAVSLIALDFFAHRPLLSKKVIFEKIPFFILSAIFGYIAIKAQQSSQSIATNDPWNFGHRIFFASFSFITYLYKLVVPIDMSIFYPYPRGTEMPKILVLYFVGAAGIVGLFFFFLKKARAAAFGLLFFALNIVFLLQLLPVGKAIMAERYTYIPSIGIMFLFAIGYKSLVKRLPAATWVIRVVFALYIGVLGYLTNERSKLWGTALDLWTNVLQQFPNCELAYNNRGDILSNLKPEPDYDAALSDFNRAIELDPNYDQTFYNRGVVKANIANRFRASDQKKFVELKQEAVKDFNKALELKPTYAQAFSNRGATRFELGDPKGAIEDFSKAVEFKPDYMIAYSNRGSAKAMVGDMNGALEDFDKVIQYDPNNAKAYYFKGLVQYDLGKKDEGCRNLRMAVELGFDAAKPELEKRCGK